MCLLLIAQTSHTLSYGTWTAPFFRTLTLKKLDERTLTQWKFNDNTCKGLGRYYTVNYPKSLARSGASQKDVAFYKNIPFASLHGDVRQLDLPRTFFSSLRIKNQERLAAIEPRTSRIAIPADFKTEPHARNSTIELVYSSFNQLEFDIISDGSGYVIIRYPYMENWEAFVNDIPVPVYRANALYIAVPVPVGNSTLNLRYKALSHHDGMIISCITLALLLSWAAMRLATSRKRRLAVIGAVLLALALYVLWARSLYNGDNLGYKYIRQIPQPVASPSG